MTSREARFWKFVEPIMDDRGCWEWRGNRDSKNYGRLIFQHERIFAHRFSYGLHVSDPGNLCVLHKCDNPPCVNPAHLFLGTKADNNRDRKAKTNYAVGVNNPRAKLTQDRADEIRRLRREGWKYEALSQMFSISKANISYIVNGRYWSDE